MGRPIKNNSIVKDFIVAESVEPKSAKICERLKNNNKKRYLESDDDILVVRDKPFESEDEELPDLNENKKKLKVKFEKEEKPKQVHIDEDIAREKYFEIFKEHNKDKLNELSSTISVLIYLCFKFYVESANNFQTGFEKIECTLKNGFNQLEKIWSEQKQEDVKSKSDNSLLQTNNQKTNPNISSLIDKNRASNFFQSTQFSSQHDFTDSDSSSDSFSDDSEEEAELEPLKYSEVPNLFLQARSIQHFSVLLMMRLFKRSELTSEYNVNGKTISATDQKKALDPMRIDNIRKIVLDKVEGDEKKKKAFGNNAFQA
ncbi:unnamed protein product [Brachionus calyciflorus]|uniref:Uncharacterized protein n=1 Tax=Brachionus calyciflorus TaxID=104777 RepID=A0A814JN06_9BILA|nr:unnamed protein product [Brachionus calyciflorus]